MQAQKEKEALLHKELSGHYRIRYGQDYSLLYHSFWNNTLLKDIAPGGNSSALDCGCGNGILLERLTANFKKVFGLDLSYDLIRQVDIKNENFKGVIIADAEKMPLKEGSFDLIVCRGALHHLPSPAAALREIYSKLKTGGYLVLSEPCNDSLILRLPRKIYREKSGRFTQGHRAFGSRDIKGLLTGEGFMLKESRYFGMLAFPLCGLSDFLPLLKRMAFRNALTRMLIVIDEFFARIPFLKRQCWHIIIKAQK
ncbi:MAG: class I SAM-dependent methyltransferase [Candidatus Omnitrophica bacterium]|nr:class I SAM-dependent methyltransferase [Candidatus Omnitrophota bacterium]